MEWTAPAQCPTDTVVRAAVDRSLAREELGPGLDEVVVAGSIVEDPQGWRLEVVVTLPQGHVERALVADDCRELGDAAGLIVAVALDPLRVVETIEDTRRDTGPGVESVPIPVAPAVEQQHEAERAPKVEPLPPPPPPSPPPRPAVDLRLGGLVEIGSLTAVRGGVGAGVGLAGRGWRADFVAQYWGPRSVRSFASAPGAGVSVQHTAAALRGCVAPRAGPVELPSCAGFEAGATFGRGIGLDAPQSFALPWVAVTLGQELAWTSRRRIGLWIGVDAMLHLVRPQLRVRDLGLTAQVRRVGVRIIGGPTVRL